MVDSAVGKRVACSESSKKLEIAHGALGNLPSGHGRPRKSCDIARSAAERPAIVLALPTATQSRLGTLATLSALAPVSHEFSL